MKYQLSKILKFLEFLNNVKEIKRDVKNKNGQRVENDAEHCFQPAVFSWYLIEAYHLKLNINKAIKYSLCHDLVEVFSGDVNPYFSSRKKIKNKKSNEAKALVKIVKQFPEFQTVKKIVDAYEAKKDPESRFVYALEQTLPALNIYLADDPYYSNKGINFDKWRRYNEAKTNTSPELKGYFEVVAAFLSKKKNFFAK